MVPFAQNGDTNLTPKEQEEEHKKYLENAKRLQGEFLPFIRDEGMEAMEGALAQGREEYLKTTGPDARAGRKEAEASAASWDALDRHIDDIETAPAKAELQRTLARESTYGLSDTPQIADGLAYSTASAPKTVAPPQVDPRTLAQYKEALGNKATGLSDEEVVALYEQLVRRERTDSRKPSLSTQRNFTL
jgi:hypothetical protein